jgi:hypothetical protein
MAAMQGAQQQQYNREQEEFYDRMIRQRQIRLVDRKGFYKDVPAPRVRDFQGRIEVALMSPVHHALIKATDVPIAQAFKTTFEYHHTDNLTGTAEYHEVGEEPLVTEIIPVTLPPAKSKT